MVHDHADEGPGGQERIDTAERAVLNPGLDVGRQMVVKHFVVFAEKHVGQFVAFQRAEQQESQQSGVDAGADPIARDQGKDTPVVPLLGGFLDCAEEFADREFFREDRGVERAFGREVFEDQGFADAGGSGDLFRGGAVEAFFCEQGSGCLNQAGLPFLAGLSGWSRRPHHILVSNHLLTGK